MAKTRIVLNWENVSTEILKNDEILGVCQSVAADGLAQLIDGYASRTATMKKRMGVNVYPATKEAREDNLSNNSLAKVFRI